MIEISVNIGDVLDEAADALVCPANPWLNLSGGAYFIENGPRGRDEIERVARRLARLDIR
jgi:hypothetical protein